MHSFELFSFQRHKQRDQKAWSARHGTNERPSETCFFCCCIVRKIFWTLVETGLDWTTEWRSCYADSLTLLYWNTYIYFTFIFILIFSSFSFDFSEVFSNYFFFLLLHCTNTTVFCPFTIYEEKLWEMIAKKL